MAIPPDVAGAFAPSPRSGLGRTGHRERPSRRPLALAEQVYRRFSLPISVEHGAAGLNSAAGSRTPPWMRPDMLNDPLPIGGRGGMRFYEI